MEKFLNPKDNVEKKVADMLKTTLNTTTSIEEPPKPEEPIMDKIVEKPVETPPLEIVCETFTTPVVEQVVFDNDLEIVD